MVNVGGDKNINSTIYSRNYKYVYVFCLFFQNVLKVVVLTKSSLKKIQRSDEDSAHGAQDEEAVRDCQTLKQLVESFFKTALSHHHNHHNVPWLSSTFQNILVNLNKLCTPTIPKMPTIGTKTPSITYSGTECLKIKY